MLTVTFSPHCHHTLTRSQIFEADADTLWPSAYQLAATVLCAVCQALRQPTCPRGKIPLCSLHTVIFFSENCMQGFVSFRMKSSCVRLQRMRLPLIRRKQTFSSYPSVVILDRNTRKTWWRETWASALLPPSLWRPEAPGFTFNLSLSGPAAQRPRHTLPQ